MKKTKFEIWTHFILRAMSANVCISFAVIGAVMNMPTWINVFGGFCGCICGVLAIQAVIYVWKKQKMRKKKDELLKEEDKVFDSMPQKLKHKMFTLKSGSSLNDLLEGLSIEEKELAERWYRLWDEAFDICREWLQP